MNPVLGWLIIATIIGSSIGALYYMLWIKIEVTAKYLVSIVTTIAVVYVGYDLLITVFSYGTWAVFFKKFVGSIIIILPISYMLYWLEKLKIKKAYEQIVKKEKPTKQGMKIKDTLYSFLEQKIDIWKLLLIILLTITIIVMSLSKMSSSDNVSDVLVIILFLVVPILSTVIVNRVYSLFQKITS